MFMIQYWQNAQKKMGVYSYLIIHVQNALKVMFFKGVHAPQKYHFVHHIMVHSAKHANMNLWNQNLTV